MSLATLRVLRSVASWPEVMTASSGLRRVLLVALGLGVEDVELLLGHGLGLGVAALGVEVIDVVTGLAA